MAQSGWVVAQRIRSFSRAGKPRAPHCGGAPPQSPIQWWGAGLRMCISNRFPGGFCCWPGGSPFSFWGETSKRESESLGWGGTEGS